MTNLLITYEPDKTTMETNMSVTGSHLETVSAIRARLLDMLAAGGIPGEDSYKLMLASHNAVLNEIEKSRLKAEAEAIRLEKQAAVERAKAEGCRTLRTIIYNAINDFATAAEADKSQREALEALRAHPEGGPDMDDDEDDDETDEVSEEEKAALEQIKKKQSKKKRTKTIKRDS